MAAGSNIVYCHCAGYNAAEQDTRRAVLAGLCESGRSFVAIPDLCRLAARSDPQISELAACSDLRIAVCFPRTMRWLFARAGAELPTNAIVANMRTAPATDALDRLTADFESADAAASLIPQMVIHSDGDELPPPQRQAKIVITLLENQVSVLISDLPQQGNAGDGLVHMHWSELAELDEAAIVNRIEDLRRDARLGVAETWVPWFPVIDYSRCKQCGQCLNFCLFGTYSQPDAGCIEVSQPDHCKTNCPACARTCPEVAIIFPKHPTGPINGDIPTDEDTGEQVKVDAASLASGDVYAALRGRGAGKQLDELADKLQVPPEVRKTLQGDQP